MRIFIIVADEPLFHPRFVREIIKAKGEEVIGITGVPEGFGSVSGLSHLSKLIALLGLKASLILGTKKIAYRALGKMPLRRAYSIEAIAKHYGIPFLPARDINSKSYLQEISSLQPDVIVSSQGYKFGDELLRLPRYGCINRHSSLLPKYKGLYPVFWAMLNDEKEVGVSVHVMAPEFDAGGVIAQRKIELTDKDTMLTLYEKCFAISSGVVLEALDKIGGAEFPSTDKGSYFGFPAKDDIKLFKEKGKKII